MIHNANGDRKYLDPKERRQFIETLKSCPLPERSFCKFLVYSGCRISEALELTSSRVDVSGGLVVIRSLKKRRPDSYRAIPIPRDCIHDLFLQAESFDASPGERLWPWCRTKAWMVVKSTLERIGVTGAHANPKGLRHAFAVHALQCGVPITVLQRWLGHARVETTAIYTNVSGREERTLAARMWVNDR